MLLRPPARERATTHQQAAVVRDIAGDIDDDDKYDDSDGNESDEDAAVGSPQEKRQKPSAT